MGVFESLPLAAIVLTIPLSPYPPTNLMTRKMKRKRFSTPPHPFAFQWIVIATAIFYVQTAVTWTVLPISSTRRQHPPRLHREDSLIPKGQGPPLLRWEASNPPLLLVASEDGDSQREEELFGESLLSCLWHAAGGSFVWFYRNGWR